MMARIVMTVEVENCPGLRVHILTDPPALQIERIDGGLVKVEANELRHLIGVLILSASDLAAMAVSEYEPVTTVRCEFVNPNTGTRCQIRTSKPPYCHLHQEGRPEYKIKNPRCIARTRKGKRCIKSSGGHDSGLCAIHRKGSKEDVSTS